jgi:hypothetical protein
MMRRRRRRRRMERMRRRKKRRRKKNNILNEIDNVDEVTLHVLLLCLCGYAGI